MISALVESSILQKPKNMTKKLGLMILNVAEWLTRGTANAMSFGRAGSNPAAFRSEEFFFSFKLQ
ncbi:hypothetical protein HMI54_000921 [Coelomomyces lativittatus]|nr:hypothetical protein HMI54_000921 [Coelomomyces lativittatus]